MVGHDIDLRCGWVDDPKEVERVLATMDKPLLSDHGIPPIQTETDIFYWEVEQQFLGSIRPSWDQGPIGTCVSFGWGRGCNDLMILEIAKGGESEAYDEEVATEPIYALSRVEIGGQRNSYSDGSVGAWAADAVTKFGILLRKVYGSTDLSKYDTKRAKEWGAKGLPDDLEPIAKEHPVKKTALVQSSEEIKAAILNLYPVPICSNVGFTTKRQGGFCRPSGQWNHCMLVRGFGTVKGNKPAFAIQNSWGDYLGSEQANFILESGREVTLPSGCFLIEQDAMERIAKQRDSFAVSAFQGFPAQTFQWIF